MRDYYVSKQKRLLKLFDFMFRPIKAKLMSYYGEQYAAETVLKSRHYFEEIIPQLPYVGGMKNYYTPIIIVNGMIIAMFKEMRDTGNTAPDVIRVWAEAADDLFAKIPVRLAHMGGSMLLSKPVVKAFKRHTIMSQERRYPEDWVYELLDGDGEAFDVGFEFSECAVI